MNICDNLYDVTSNKLKSPPSTPLTFNNNNFEQNKTEKKFKFQ